MPDAELILRTALSTYAHTLALKDGAVQSPRLRLLHEEITPISKAFRPMANDLAFDLCEMALATYMLAKASGRPVIGLPIVLMRNCPHAAIVCSRRSQIRNPQDLTGRTIGVRAYTQTTGIWVRAILQSQFGVSLDTLRWLTLEGAHVEGFREPPNVIRAAAGKGLADMFIEGQIDAAVGFKDPAYCEVRPLFEDPERAEAQWLRLTGVRTINHIVVVNEHIANAYPWLKGELFQMFEEAKNRVPNVGRLENGLEPNRAAIEALARYSFEQGIIPRPMTAAELFPSL